MTTTMTDSVVYKLFVDYGYGYEFETAISGWAEYKEAKVKYADNCGYPHKWIDGNEGGVA